MNILIISGGTGSEALQKGIFDMLDGDLKNHKVKVLVNAYDNGKSTGTVRVQSGGMILGPSDIRKNQTTVHELMYGKTAILELFNIRFNAENTQIAEKYVMSQIDGCSISGTKKFYLKALASYYFSNFIIDTDYVFTDFSLANILYASAMYCNNAKIAIQEMAYILDIPEDYVILNSSQNLYLHAKTANGSILYDEADIVTWNSLEPIVDVYFTNRYQEKETPVLSEEATKAIAEAGIIICSSGTQWSSLIPTYKTEGFAEAIAASQARKFLVLNRTQDKDMLGVKYNSMVSTIERFLPLDRFTILEDTSAKDMGKLEIDHFANFAKMSKDFSNSNCKHDPEKLALAIFGSHFRMLDNGLPDVLAVDLDGTLRNSSDENIYTRNVGYVLECKKHISTYLITGNDVNSFSECISAFDDIYFDGGNSIYSEQGTKFISDFARFSDKEVREITKVLNSLGIFYFENRNNNRICIREVSPVFRETLVDILQSKIPDAVVSKAGKYTIEVYKQINNKNLAIADIIKKSAVENETRILFIGDEIQSGNDWPVFSMLARRKAHSLCAETNSPYTTSVILKTFLGILKNV